MTDTGPETPQSSLTERTISGLNWKFFSVAGQAVLSLIVGIILARLIPPKDYGLLGMAYIFTGFAGVFASVGMGPAIIQKQNLTPDHIRIAMILSTLLGVIITCILWALSDPIAHFFGNPQVSPVLRAISLTFVLGGISTTSRAMLRRKLRYDSLFRVEFASMMSGSIIVSVPMAFLGYGVWSLVAGTLTSALVSCVLLIIFAKPPYTLSFNRQEVKDLLSFGGGVTINNLINYTARNIDFFIVGKFLSASQLGLYTRAFNLMSLPISHITTVLSSVLFPAYAEVQGELKRLSTAYFKAINATTIIVFPIMIAMAVSAEYIVVGLYGPNWAGAVKVFRILCLAGFLRNVFHLSGSVTYATGRIYSEVRRQFVYLILLIVGCLTGVRYGIEGVGAAIIIGCLWMYFSMAWLTLKIIDSSWLDFFKTQLPGFTLAFIVGVVDIIFMIILEVFFPDKIISAKLLMMFIISLTTLLLSIIYLPVRFKGEMPSWLASRYSIYLPKPIRGWVLQHF